MPKNFQPIDNGGQDNSFPVPSLAQYKSIEKFVKILQEDPNNVRASFLLGLLLHQVNENEKAEALVSKAIALGAENYEAYRTLGAIYSSLKKFEKASICEKKANTFNPDYIDCYYNIGCNLLNLKEYTEAIRNFQKAVLLSPDHYEAHNNLGIAYHNEKMFKESLESFDKTLRIKPDYPIAYLGIANTLRDMGQPDAAIANYKKAIAIDPTFVEAHNNLGRTQMDLGLYEDASISYNVANDKAPDNAGVHMNIGVLNLLIGNFEIGWKEYSWRRFDEDIGLTNRVYSQPLWSGEDLNGKTIFVYTEQGLGDTIQFVRYLDLLQKQGGSVLLDAQLPLESLLKSMESINVLLKEDELLPIFDYHIPLMDLPRLFGTNAENIPSSSGYLNADKNLIEAWKKRLGPRKGYRIGLAWAGSPEHQSDTNRSMSLKDFEPLLGIEGFDFFSLQFGERSQDITSLGFGHALKNLEQDLNGFMEPAAAIINMDLVISVDTSLVHLAGALGKPVWTLLSFNSDWRWMLKRSDSPWYSSMRLFRQEKPGDWASVIDLVASELNKLVK